MLWSGHRTYEQRQRDLCIDASLERAKPALRRKPTSPLEASPRTTEPPSRLSDPQSNLVQPDPRENGSSPSAEIKV